MRDLEKKLSSLEVKSEIIKENPLWEFSVIIYEEKRIRKIFLELQDEFGLDVVVIIFCLWLSFIQGSRSKYKILLRMAVSVSEIWQREIIKPIRKCRQSLKVAIRDSDLENSKKLLASNLRNDIKFNELTLEALEVLVLYNEFLRIFNKNIQKIESVNFSLNDAQEFIFHYIEINGTNLSEKLSSKVIELVNSISGSRIPTRSLREA